MGKTTFSPTLSRDKIFNLGERELIDIVTKETVTVNEKTFNCEQIRNSGLVSIITIGEIATDSEGNEWALKDIGIPRINQILAMNPNL